MGPEDFSWASKLLCKTSPTYFHCLLLHYYPQRKDVFHNSLISIPLCWKHICRCWIIVSRFLLHPQETFCPQLPIWVWPGLLSDKALGVFTKHLLKAWASCWLIAVDKSCPLHLTTPYFLPHFILVENGVSSLCKITPNLENFVIVRRIKELSKDR